MGEDDDETTSSEEVPAEPLNESWFSLDQSGEQAPDFVEFSGASNTNG